MEQAAEAGEVPWAVARLRTGYVGLDHLQVYRGYTFFIARTCVRELFELEGDERALHLHEMSEVAHAVYRAFEPMKLNVEALGNSTPHLHWHIVPRHAADPRPFAPIWENLEFLRAVWTQTPDAQAAERDDLKTLLASELERADVTVERLF